MAENGENSEFFGGSRLSFFTRSMTLHSPALDPPRKPSVDRSQSIKKLYTSLESMVKPSNSIKGKVKKLCSLFEKSSISEESQHLAPLKSKHSKLNSVTDSRVRGSSWIQLPGTEDRIVVYFTSLRGIRRTFEDCYAVRTIFRGFRVWVDERDVSMDSAYRKELQSVLGEKRVSLPQVFIRGKHIGGAEVVRQLYEIGELAKLCEGIPIRKPGYFCESCGDARFLPCTNCSGSRKIFDDDEGVARRCLDCNENGLMRCHNCCS